VTVNYNTRDLVALLLWSIHRTLGGQVRSVIVVDNGSTDGSRSLLEDCRDAGLCELIANNENRYHGPALNQAMSHLATRERQEHVEPVGWVWLLDSDCVVVRTDTLRDVLSAAADHDAALIGEHTWDPWHRCDRVGLHSMVIDPAQTWKPTFPPFSDHGDPAYELECSCLAAQIPVVAFPFVSRGYIIHRGRGTLASIHARGEDTNCLYGWATTHHEAHFERVPGAAATYARLVDQFNETVPILDAEHLLPACPRSA
jgi:hypothetical protein